MPGINLTFINQSNDTNNSQVVIFQKNVAINVDEFAVAWKVIQNCGPGWNHPFTFSGQFYTAAGDSWGNHSPQVPAAGGQTFSVVATPSGDVLQLMSESADTHEIGISNDLQTGAISANIFMDGSLLATKTNVSPGQKAVFQFKPTIWVGVVSQLTEGDVINSAILSQVNTEISLLGLKSADIVMTGGGPGSSSTPFIFTLQNVVYA
jgi:hypothetical protein